MTRKSVVVSLAVAFVVLAAGLDDPAPVRAQQRSQEPAHIEWVYGVLTRMETIKPGMTRTQLLKVFDPEAGIVALPPVKRSFLSLDCPYFKVDVEFELQRDTGPGRWESGDDRILKISRPYVGRYTLD